MTEFTLHTLETAPEQARDLLQTAQKQLGFIPNLYAAMAESPATLEAYRSLSALFDNSSFNVTERQLLLLSISRHRNCCYCLAAHGALAKMNNIPSDIVTAIYYNQPLADNRLEALRDFARAVLKDDGWVDRQALQSFYQAGYNKQQVLEVVLAITFKTLSNYINHINDTPVDSQFLAGLPENFSSTCKKH